MLQNKLNKQTEMIVIIDTRKVIFLSKYGL